MKKSKKNKAIRATIIASVIIAAGLALASCLTGRFGFDGSLTTPPTLSASPTTRRLP